MGAAAGGACPLSSGGLHRGCVRVRVRAQLRQVVATLKCAMLSSPTLRHRVGPVGGRLLVVTAFEYLSGWNPMKTGGSFVRFHV